MYEPKKIITITKRDHRRLSDVAVLYAESDGAAARSLQKALGRAALVDSYDVAPSFGPMNSRVTCRIANGEQRVIALVYPRQADVSRGHISVLAPLGRALLGSAAGDHVRAVVGSGRTLSWAIERIEYQPEAAGDYHL